MTADTTSNATDGTRIGRLWTANLLGPLASLAGLETAYAFTDHACDTGRSTAVHVSFLIFLLAAVAGAAIGWHEWRRWGADEDTETGGREARSRFLALVGLVTSGLSALAIATQWSASIFLHPCQ